MSQRASVALVLVALSFVTTLAAQSDGERKVPIGAIALPESIRTYVVSHYRGYRFVETARIEHAQAPRQYQVILSKDPETLTLRFGADGKLVSSKSTSPPPAPPIVVAGTWRGRFICTQADSAC